MHSFGSHVSRFVGVHEVMNTINTVCTSVINCVIDMPGADSEGGVEMIFTINFNHIWTQHHIW